MKEQNKDRLRIPAHPAMEIISGMLDSYYCDFAMRRLAASPFYAMQQSDLPPLADINSPAIIRRREIR